MKNQKWTYRFLAYMFILTGTMNILLAYFRHQGCDGSSLLAGAFLGSGATFLLVIFLNRKKPS